MAPRVRGGPMVRRRVWLTFFLGLALAGRAVLSLRNRLDVNVSAGKSDPCYRIRERIEHEVRIRKTVLNPYAHIEFIMGGSGGAWGWWSAST